MKTKTKTKNRFFRFEFNINFFNYLISILIIIVGFNYVICANNLSVQGYKLRDLKSKMRDLKDNLAENEIKAMALESYQNINKRAKDMKLVKAEKIEYINDAIETVAVK